VRAQAGDADGHSSSCGASERVAVLLLLRDAAESADAASFPQIASAVCIAWMPAVVNSTDLTVATPPPQHFHNPINSWRGGLLTQRELFAVKCLVCTRNSDVSDARYTRKNVS